MKKLLAVLFMGFALAACDFGGILSKAQAADKVCSVATEQEFHQNIAPLKAKVYVGNQKALDLILKSINDPRAKSGLFLVEADKVIIGIFDTPVGTKVGVAMFKDGCLVPATLTSMPIEAWESFMTILGVVFEDFTKESDA